MSIIEKALGKLGPEEKERQARERAGRHGSVVREVRMIPLRRRSSGDWPASEQSRDHLRRRPPDPIGAEDAGRRGIARRGVARSPAGGARRRGTRPRRQQSIFPLKTCTSAVT